MGLPPLQPPGGLLDRNTRFSPLNERLAAHVHAATPRVTPGRGTRATIEWEHPPTRESGDNEPTDDKSLGPTPYQTTPVDVPTLTRRAEAIPRQVGVDITDVGVRASPVAASVNAHDGAVEYPTEVDNIGGGSTTDPHHEFPTAAGFEWELFL